MKYLLTLTALLLSISTNANENIINSLTKEATVSILETKGDLIHVSVTQWIKKPSVKKEEVKIKTETKASIKFISAKQELKGQDFGRQSAPYKKHIRCFVRFQNVSDKTITGVIYKITYKDSFNKELISGSMQDSLSLKPGKTSVYNVFRYYEHNDYNTNSTYSKLWGSVNSKTLKIFVEIEAVSFKDGTVIDYRKSSK